MDFQNKTGSADVRAMKESSMWSFIWVINYGATLTFMLGATLKRHLLAVRSDQSFEHSSSSTSPKQQSLIVFVPAGVSTQPKSLETLEDHKSALKMIGPSVLLPLQVNRLVSLLQRSTGTEPRVALLSFGMFLTLTKSSNKPKIL